MVRAVPRVDQGRGLATIGGVEGQATVVGEEHVLAIGCEMDPRAPLRRHRPADVDAVAAKVPVAEADLGIGGAAPGRDHQTRAAVAEEGGRAHGGTLAPARLAAGVHLDQPQDRALLHEQTLPVA